MIQSRAQEAEVEYEKWVTTNPKSDSRAGYIAGYVTGGEVRAVEFLCSWRRDECRKRLWSDVILAERRNHHVDPARVADEVVAEYDERFLMTE